MDNEYIDPSRRSAKELILQLIDQMDQMEKKVDKHMENDMKEVKNQVHDLKIKIAVIQAKAAGFGTAGGSIVGALISYLMK